jgi:carnitine 3-dehydrogenase
MSRAAVVGVGTIGAGWATLFAASGWEVALYDESRECLQRSQGLIEAGLGFMHQSKLAKVDSFEQSVSRLLPCDSLETALDGAQFVQESIVEDYEKKAVLYDQVEKSIPHSVPVASSTSGLLISRMQQGRQNPQRFIIGHPWNPPYLLPLVEVVPGPLTSSAITDQVCCVYRDLGMDPVLVRKEVPGHIGNRLAAALWREAIDLVDQGVATVEDVDRAIRSGPGLRWALMGAHLTYHLGGGPAGIEYFIDHLRPAFESWWSDMATWSTFPDGAQAKLAAGVEGVVGESPYEDLVERRDELLVALLGLNSNRRERNPLKDPGSKIAAVDGRG